MKKRTNRQGTSGIYCRLTTPKKITEFSTGIFIPPSVWQNCKIVSDEPQHLVYADLLNALHAKIIAACYEQVTKNNDIDIIQVRNAICERKTYTLFIDVIRTYTAKVEKSNLKPQTIRKYSFYFKNVFNWARDKKLLDLKAEDFKPYHTEMFRDWCKENVECSFNYSSRMIEFIKRAYSHAVFFEVIKASPIIALKTGREKSKEIKAMNVAEVERLTDKNFKNEIVNQIKDLFLFQCYTGLSYADLYNFQTTRIQGRLWIVSQREKNGHTYTLPFFQKAFDIYTRYSGKLPRITNQGYNRILKEISALCEIEVPLTTHVARKTFATLRNEEGWSLDSIADMLGHDSPRTTKNHYIKPTINRVANEAKRMGYC